MKVTVTFINVRTGIRTVVAERGKVGRVSVPVKDALGKAIRHVAEREELDPMRVMSDPHYNRFLMEVHVDDH